MALTLTGNEVQNHNQLNPLKAKPGQDRPGERPAGGVPGGSTSQPAAVVLAGNLAAGTLAPDTVSQSPVADSVELRTTQEGQVTQGSPVDDAEAARRTLNSIMESIRQQPTAALKAQANQLPESALQLLQD